MLYIISKKWVNPFSLLISLIIVFTISANAQIVIEKTPANLRIQWYENHVELKENSIFKNLPWQFIGPTNVSGRINDVEVVTPKGENYTIYIASASGGIWKTDNE